MPNIADHLKEKLNRIPELPGIYKFYNAEGTIIYIGKSKCLKKRVKSYFVKTPKWEKVKKMVCFIRDIEYIVTDTHLEARLLECELIKTIRPYFNAQMKNEQRYVYLKVADYNGFNPLTVVSEREEDSFGPFRSRYTLMDILDSLKNIYPISMKGQSYDIDYHLLPVTLNKDSFTENKTNLLNLLSDSGNMDLFIQELENKMKEAASFYKYETASMYRDIISGIKYIKHGINAYENLLSRNILLKLPFPEGIKLIFVSGGTILLKEKYTELTEKDIQVFIKKGKSKTGSKRKDLSIHNEMLPGEMALNEKIRIDFRDVLCSEIIALPEEMVTLL